MKLHINIWTLWHIDHGKTTLTCAISKVLGLKYNTWSWTDFDKIDSLPEEKARGITIRTSHVHYETESRSYNSLDVPGHSDFIKNAILGLNQMDYWILLVDGNDGVMSQTREHVLLWKQIGLWKLAVFINKCDVVDDQELLDIVEMDIVDLLEKVGYTSEDYFIVRWSALLALNNPTDYSIKYGSQVILDMFSMIESKFSLPDRKEDKSFIMSVEEAFVIKWRWTVITWTPIQGKIKLGDTIEIIDKKKETPVKTVVTGIQQFHKDLSVWVAWTNLWLLLRGVEKNLVWRWDTVTIPNTYSRVKKAKAVFYMLSTNEGGRKNPIFQWYYPIIFLRNDDIRAKINFWLEKEMILPGDYFEWDLQFDYPVIIEKDSTFSIREWNQTVGSWKVIEIM